MSDAGSALDPWGPISAILAGLGDADFYLNATKLTGVDFKFVPLSDKENYSHSTRIRAYQRYVDKAHSALADDRKGPFAQIVVKAMLARHDADGIREKLKAALADIGWSISPDGALRTDDTLIAEQFFQPGTPFDAYIAIRDILARAKASLTVVDGYLGATFLKTLRGLNRPLGQVRLLTVAKHLKPDFSTEATHFKAQFPRVPLEIRETNDFHDRFIVVDGTEFYFIGASIKDAGKKAFMISRIQDQLNVDAVRTAIETAWHNGKVHPI